MSLLSTLFTSALKSANSASWQSCCFFYSSHHLHTHARGGEATRDVSVVDRWMMVARVAQSFRKEKGVAESSPEVARAVVGSHGAFRSGASGTFNVVSLSRAQVLTAEPTFWTTAFHWYTRSAHSLRHRHQHPYATSCSAPSV